MTSSRRLILTGLVAITLLGGALLLSIGTDQRDVQPVSASPESEDTDTANLPVASGPAPVRKEPLVPVAAQPDDLERLFDCEVDYGMGSAQMSEAERDAHGKKVQAEIRDELSRSSDAEHLLMAAIIGFDPNSEQGLDAMNRAFKADPRNPLVLYNFLELCSRHRDRSICRDGTIERQALEVDGGNGAQWATIAATRAERGDDDGALRALISSYTAPQFNEYWVEHVEMFERGLSASTELQYPQRVIFGIGMAAALTSGVANLVNVCRSKAEESLNWLHACIEFGERMERDAQTIMSAAIGSGVQRHLYLKLGEDAKAARAKARGEALMAFMTEESLHDREVLLFSDEILLADYLREISAHGEVAAMRFLNDQYEIVRQSGDYDPCDNLSN